MRGKYQHRFRRSSAKSDLTSRFLPLQSMDSVYQTQGERWSEEQQAPPPQKIPLDSVGPKPEDPPSQGRDRGGDSSGPVKETTYSSVWKRATIMLGLCLALLCMSLDNSILATAIPKITDEFSSLDDMGWYVSAYSLAQCSMTLVYGKLFTYYTIKWVYLIALFLFELGSLICGVAPSSIALIIGRAVAGVGGSGLYVGSLLIVSVIIPANKRPLYNGILSSLYATAGVFGPLIGGALTDYASWRWCFYINLPIGGVTGFFILLLFHAARPTKQRHSSAREQLLELDIVGLIMFIPALISLLLALQWGGAEYPWHSWRIILLIIVFGVLILAFAGVEYWQKDRATIPVGLIRRRDVWGTGLFSFFLVGSIVIFTYYLPIWFQSVKGTSATMSGVMNIPLIVSVAITAMLAGWAVSAVGYYTPFMYACAVIASIGAGMLSTLTVGSGHPAWIGFQALYGIGAGIGFGLPIAVIQVSLPTDKISSGTAIITFIQGLTGALCNFIAQSVFQTQLMRVLMEKAPNLDADKLMDSGATMLRHLVEPDMLPAVLDAYNTAIMRVFTLGAGLAAASVLGVLPLRWVNVKEKKLEPAAG
ncbi:major facilitator superfamily-domain-containing protein [Aspergillus pseudoustus]|uniref:Major facilitator superfamily-domain-containing protein n=1 Tax=Aspergillus pseudoustus TaxID=1810923 RepID=A0ABR4JI86_9EURO